MRSPKRWLCRRRRQEAVQWWGHSQTVIAPEEIRTTDPQIRSLDVRSRDHDYDDHLIVFSRSPRGEISELHVGLKGTMNALFLKDLADIPDIHPNVSGIYRKKVERLTEALNTPKDRNEAAEAIRALVEKITLRPGPNRGEIDATLHGELGTILGWIEAQAVGKARKRETPAAFEGLATTDTDIR